MRGWGKVTEFESEREKGDSMRGRCIVHVSLFLYAAHSTQKTERMSFSLILDPFHLNGELQIETSLT